MKNDIDINVCPDCGCIMADVDFCHDQYEIDDYYTMSRKTALGIEYEWGIQMALHLEKNGRNQGGAKLLDVGGVMVIS